MDYLTQKKDREFIDKLWEERKAAEERGESYALIRKDWHIGWYSYLNHRYILILDADKNLLAVADESDLLALFGHQVWLAFLRRVGISEHIGYDQRPRLDGVQPTGRLGVPPWHIYGAQVREILNWIP